MFPETERPAQTGLQKLYPVLKTQYLIGSKSTVARYNLEEPETEGAKYLEDIWALEQKFGLKDTYSYHWDFFFYELYDVFWSQTFSNLGFSLVIVTLVVFVLTANGVVAVLIVLSLIFICITTLGMSHYLGLTLNNVVALNLSLSLGIAVDYAVHIANSFLSIKAPKSEGLSRHEQREFKAREAISRMGSSVIHGSISTLLAFIVIKFGKLITFQIFFKNWVTFVIAGIINGICLIPVLLSMCGPLDEIDDSKTSGALPVSNKDEREMVQIDNSHVPTIPSENVMNQTSTPLGGLYTSPGNTLGGV